MNHPSIAPEQPPSVIDIPSVQHDLPTLVIPRRKYAKPMKPPIEAFGELIDDGETRDSKPNYMPTPAQIAAECAKIRETWDDHRWRNQADAPEPVELRVAKIDH